MNEKELDKLGSIDGRKYSDIYKEKIVDIANDFDVIYKDFFKQYEISNIRVGKITKRV